MSNGLYIHIPYCRQKCGYCGFVSYPVREGGVPGDFTNCLFREMALYHAGTENCPVDTVFIGGGTPSLLTPVQFSELVSRTRQHFSVTQDAEITCEANPDSLTEDLLSAMRENGVTRLSIGAQSLDDGLLGTLGRIHDRRGFLTAYERAVSAGFDNINIDLMFGIPGQTHAQWMTTLKEVTALKPAHLSVYTIQLEEGTPFYEAYKDGRLDLPPYALDRRMYHDAKALLEECGYEHYEISNFALPGKACRHNLKYWAMEPFIGLGPAAASYFDGCRYQNPPDLHSWSRMIEGGRTALDSASPESADDAMEIFCFTALRTRQGLDTERFLKRFGKAMEEAYHSDPPPVSKWIRDGLIVREGSCLRLTEEGIAVSNEIMSAFMRGTDAPDHPA